MADAEPPLIELAGVGRVYRRAGVRGRGVATRALSGVTLRIERGEFVAIMGPSGSGKPNLKGKSWRVAAPSIVPDAGMAPRHYRPDAGENDAKPERRPRFATRGIPVVTGR